MAPGRDTANRDASLVELTFVVLAGGRSTRFGSNKLAASVQGVPLLQRVLDAIPAQVPVVLAGASFPAEFVSRVNARVVTERPAFGGPLCGLLAAVPHIVTPVVAVVGGDMPHAVPGVLSLAGRWDPENPRMLVATDTAGRLQPLCSVLPVAVLHEAQAQLGSGRDQPLYTLLDLTEFDAVPLPDRLLLDVDHPEDLSRCLGDSDTGGQAH